MEMGITYRALDSMSARFIVVGLVGLDMLSSNNS